MCGRRPSNQTGVAFAISAKCAQSGDRSWLKAGPERKVSREIGKNYVHQARSAVLNCEAFASLDQYLSQLELEITGKRFEKRGVAVSEFG